MILSESAALATDEALKSGKGVQDINVTTLRGRLHEAGQLI